MAQTEIRLGLFVLLAITMVLNCYQFHKNVAIIVPDKIRSVCYNIDKSKRSTNFIAVMLDML